MSLAPAQRVVRDTLPAEILREKKYDIGSMVARGGMGAILEAREAAIKRQVAMKVMLDTNDAGDISRFIAEAQVTGQLEHPNIVPVHELGVDENGQPFYTMKMVRGVTLKNVVERLGTGDEAALHKYPLPALLTIFQKICDAIAFAHANGVIHRDLKPENVMIGEFGEVLVMDWGLAKRMKDGERMKAEGGRMKQSEPSAVGDENTNARSAQNASSFSDVPPSSFAGTLQGSIMGTPQYMSPEQAEGLITDMDARSDIFSLGGVLYAILTLRPPVEGKTLDEVLQKVIDGSITPPSAFGGATRQGKVTVQGKGVKAKKTSPRVEGETFDVAAPTVLAGSMVAPPVPVAAMGNGAPGAKSEVLEAKKIKPLPHCPGGRVPAALSAVAMKALSLKKEDRYQSVVEFSADLAAYQNGFATRAEHASFMKQILLLIQRNKGIFVTGFAAWLLITALAVWFVLNLRASERETRRQAEIAQQNEKKAVIGEQRAKEAEAVAVREKESTRRALLKSALALAEAARREGNGPEMQAALNDVPEDLRDSTWHYLLEQSDSSIARIRSTGTQIDSVSADPRRPGVFAIADSSGKVILLEVRTGVHLLEFQPVSALKSGGRLKLAFSPDGERIAVGREKAGLIAIHSARDGKKLLEWEAPSTKRLEFSPDGRLLLQAEADGKLLTVWDAATGQPRWKYESEGKQPLGTFTPDSQQVVTNSYHDVRLVNAQDGTLVRSLGNDAVNALAVRPDGKMILVGHGGAIKGVFLADGKVAFDFRAQEHSFAHLSFTPDGARFVSVATLPDGRQAIQLWDANTGAPLQSLLGGSGEFRDVGLHPLSGELLVAGASSRAWDLTGTPEKWTLRGGPSVAFWGSDDVVFATAPGQQAVLQKLQAGTPELLWKPPGQSYRRPSVSADGRFAAIGSIDGNAAQAAQDLFLLRNPGAHTEQAAVFKQTGGLTLLRLSPTGDHLAAITGRYNNGVALYDPTTGQQPVKLERKDMKKFWDLGWVGGGQQLVGLVTAKADRGNPGSEEWIVLWDAATGKVVRTAANRTAMDVLAVAPDGRRFAEAGADKMVRIRDAATLAVQQEFRAHDGPITALAWHPSKPIMATASADLSVKIWNIETGRRLEEFRGMVTAPTELAFSPSGQRLGCAGDGSPTRIWEPPSLNDQPAAAKPADGWEDLLAPLSRVAILQTGNGWRLENGALFSPDKIFATLPLPGNLSGTSYQVRVKLRQLTAKDVFHLELPVADQMVGFDLDGSPRDGFYTGLQRVKDKGAKDAPGALHGKQVKDSEQHDLEVTVRPDGTNATITATLDDQPLYEWTGPTADLSPVWKTPPGTLALGTSAADWVVYEVKVKRLEK